MDRSKLIFGNEISRKAYKKAVKTKAKFNGWTYRCRIISGSDVVYTKTVKLTLK